jgi:hypothetical protein
MGPISKPVTVREKHYTVMQAARRKDIERAFGALKIKFNILNRPSLTPDVTLMNRILRVCTILHNMVGLYLRARIPFVSKSSNEVGVFRLWRKNVFGVMALMEMAQWQMRLNLMHRKRIKKWRSRVSSNQRQLNLKLALHTYHI